MTDRVLRPILITFSLLSAFMLHIVIAQPQVYERILQPAVIWIFQQLYVMFSCAVGGFLELSCWMPLETMLYCFLFSILVAFVLCKYRYQLYWLSPILCCIVGWFLTKELNATVAFSVICYYGVPALLGTILGCIQEWRHRNKTSI